MLEIIRCNRCKYTARLGQQLRSYGDPDDPASRMTIEQGPAWCAACGEMTWAERLPELQELEAELGRWLNAPDHVVARWIEPGEPVAEARARQIDEARRRLEWRRARISLPRCLQCGSTGIDAFPKGPRPAGHRGSYGITHPGCGGTLTRSGGGFSNSRVWTFYTPEGLRREAFTMYPHQGMVPLE